MKSSSKTDAADGGDSLRTVVIAFVANLGVAIAKTFAAVFTGSASMVAEAAHSWADTLNQVFLLTSLFRSKKAADSTHPFGYGKERFFWSLLAAVGSVRSTWII